MNRYAKVILIAGLILLLLGSINQGGTIAQGLETPDGPGRSPQPGEGDALPAKGPGSNTSQAGEDSETAVLAPNSPAALVSSSFTYQGQLKNAGAAVNARCDFIWDIFADASGGTSLATDTDTNVQLANGLFTAVINVPASVMDGNGRYVGIQVRCPTGTGAYTILSPRQELQAAPYALGLRLPFSHAINSSIAPAFTINNTGGTGDSPAIRGSSVGSDGVQGLSTGAASADNGVYGETNSSSTNEAGVKGFSTNAAAGGYFTSSTGYGVYGGTNSPADFGGYFTNSTATTSGAAIYANGDAKQSLTGDGFVKAGLYVDCGKTGSEIFQTFNNVNTTAITVINGASDGRCTIDFGFNVSRRFVTTTAYGYNSPRTVTFVYGSTDNRLDFFRFDQDGLGLDGGIMIVVY
jgi:predicted outer membrane repeat protein